MNAQSSISLTNLSVRQIWIVVILGIVAGLEGFDIASIGLAAPGIARGFHISGVELGVALAGDVIGMTLGSIGLGIFSDKFGRRPGILLSIALMAVGSALSALSVDVSMLMAARIVTGLGIGGALVVGATAMSEHVSEKFRDSGQAVIGLGYSGLIMLGAIVVSHILRGFGWESIFWSAAVVCGVMFFVALAWVPETIPYLINHARGDGSGGHNVLRALRALGKPAIPLETIEQEISGAVVARRPWLGLDVAALFAAGRRRLSILLPLAYVGFALTLYFMLKWYAKSVVNLGFAPSDAARTMAAFGAGGLIGSVVVGVVVRYIRIKFIAPFALLLCALSPATLLLVPDTFAWMVAIGFCGGFFTKTGALSLYMTCLRAYPARMRASGMGWMLTVGRGGSIASPIITGYMYEMGSSVGLAAATMGAGSIVAGALILPVLFAKRGGDALDAGSAALGARG